MSACEAVHPDPESDGWIVSGYDAAMAALKDPRLSADKFSHIAREIPVFQLLSRMMVFVDPPDHTRLRGLVTRAFTPRVVESLRGTIQRITDDLLEAVEPAGRMDAIADLAYPLPITVIAELLGVPTEHRERFKRWSDDLFAALEFSPDQDLTALERSLAEMSAYFRARFAALRSAPGDDLLTALVQAREREDRLSEDELLANALLLLAAGHETTTNLIGNGLRALLLHPDQWARLRENPSLLPSAVEEALRFDPPVQWTSRIAQEPLTLAGVAIPAGAFVSICLAAAGRDPDVFPDPDRLDIGRAGNKSLAFGFGPHYCLGAALARLEGQIVLGTLARRFPDLRLESESAQWLPLTTFRALKALPVTWK